MKMKKYLFVLTAMLLLFTTNCKKDEVYLSDFVLGMWESDPILVDETSVVLMADFRSDLYSLAISNAFTTFFLDPVTYMVDDDLNQIMVEEPDLSILDLKSGDPIMIKYFVQWESENRSMTWTPDSSNPYAPIITWSGLR